MKIRFFQGSANSCKDSDRKKQSVHKTMDEFQSKEFGGDGDVRCEANRNKKKTKKPNGVTDCRSWVLDSAAQSKKQKINEDQRENRRPAIEIKGP